MINEPHEMVSVSARLSARGSINQETLLGTFPAVIDQCSSTFVPGRRSDGVPERTSIMLATSAMLALGSRGFCIVHVYYRVVHIPEMDIITLRYRLSLQELVLLINSDRSLSFKQQKLPDSKILSNVRP